MSAPEATITGADWARALPAARARRRSRRMLAALQIAAAIHQLNVVRARAILAANDARLAPKDPRP